MPLFRIVMVSAVLSLLAGCTAASRTDKFKDSWSGDCKVPAENIVDQIYDLCFFQFGTDEIAHEGVQSCYALFSSLKNDCESRVILKRFRCHYIAHEVGELPRGMTIEECVSSSALEGYFVNGCEYPFSDECVARVEREAVR